MCPRRDEITGMKRPQIAMSVLYPYRLRGLISGLVRACLPEVSAAIMLGCFSRAESSRRLAYIPGSGTESVNLALGV